MIVSSTYTTGPTQQDGRVPISEGHTDGDGKVYTYEWLRDTQDADMVLAARAARLNELLAAQAAAAAQVANTLLPLTKWEFRQLFGAKKGVIDEFNDSFDSNVSLTEDHKRAIRSGLKDLDASGGVVRPFIPAVLQMLGLYVALGLLTTGERDAIVAAGNG